MAAQHQQELPYLIGYPLRVDRPHVLEGALLRAVMHSRATTIPSSATQSTCSMEASSGPTIARLMAPELSDPARCM